MNRKTGKDAPSDYNTDESKAWAAGYNHAIDDFMEELGIETRAGLETSLESVMQFLAEQGRDLEQILEENQSGFAPDDMYTDAMERLISIIPEEERNKLFTISPEGHPPLTMNYFFEVIGFKSEDAVKILTHAWTEGMNPFQFYQYVKLFKYGPDVNDTNPS